MDSPLDVKERGLRKPRDYRVRGGNRQCSFGGDRKIIDSGIRATELQMEFKQVRSGFR